ncbi:translesion DNA synthesis-associated protein ImuA [Ramlibacter albus]|uniref:translesion DNA synthesis-associated protein ImuA n=1 Tax=Ramlibacter albus TaxID=2079448 RepID=UPI00338F3808
MLAATRLRLITDLNLPEVRRVSELAHHEEAVPTGHRFLDLQLPGGGWPVGSMVELLQDEPARNVWQLVAPALSELAQQQPGPVVLVGSPFEPFAPSLQSRGLDPSRLLRIEADKPKPRLWAAEQALRCADVCAVLAWLPQCKSAELRRLQLVAAEHKQLLFVMRPVRARQESSPAKLRLQIEPDQGLQVRILKRKGPPLDQPVELPEHPQRLAALLQSRKGRAQPAIPQPEERSHVLDRTLSLA